MIAEKTGYDLFEFRYQNLRRLGDLTVNGYPFREITMVEIYDGISPRPKVIGLECYEQNILQT